ncbi:MAG: hypothetical protein H6711_20140 [Myxococcales bacterium]|nr:hypothetical protein [Myxococcales bacterium]
MDDDRQGRRTLYVGIFLVAQATLILEILLTRITSVIAWYHLAFFVIALAMLGMTAGAVLVFLRPGWFAPAAIGRRLAETSLWGAIVSPLALAWVMASPLVPVTDFMSFFALVGTGAALALPFAFFGVTLTLALTRAGLPPGRAYGVDLVGAAAGALAVIPLLDRLDGGSAVLAAAAVAALGAAAFAIGARERGLLVRAGIAATLLIGLAGLNHAAEVPPLRPAWVKGQREDPATLEIVTWNTHSRVDVSPVLLEAPMFWGAGRNMPPEAITPRPTRTLRIDGAAATPMVELGAGPADHAYLDWDVATFAHRLRPLGPAAVIGVGGGRDVLAALRSGHAPVVGVELNRDIVDLHRGRLRDFSGIAGLEGVELVADEARSFLTRDRRSYAVITMSLIDTWAATGAGAYSLSENGLYTVEAWERFLDRLDPDGIFTVSRWYLRGAPGETARMIALAMEALWRRGVADPRAHIIVLQEKRTATLLLSPTPFSDADLDQMQREAVRLGFNMLMTPRKAPIHPLLAELAALPSRDALARWADAQLLDLTPPTDARPFFFSMLRPQTWLFGQVDTEGLDHGFLGNLRATQTLVYATLASLLLTVIALLVPLGLRRRELAGVPRGALLAACAYFGLIGLGFMFVEIGLLSVVGVFLGHPTLALAVVLGGIILATGVGSLLSSRIPVEEGRRAWLYPLIPALLIVAARLAAEPLTDAFAASGAGARIGLSLALIAPPALGMGLGFPLGLRLVSARALAVDLGPWLWGINGAFGVCASGLALAVSMIAGVPTTMTIGALCYLALLPATALLSRR